MTSSFPYDHLLDSIDAAEWDLVQGARGNGLEAAEALRTLVQGNGSARSLAYRELLAELVVGPGWTEAGAIATPLLVELALTLGHPSAPMARVILAELVSGDHVPRLIDGLDRSSPVVAAPFTHPPASVILDVVRAAIDDLAAGLRDERTTIRSTTAFLLAFDSERADQSFTEIERCISLESHDWTRASMLLALAHLARYQGRVLRTSDLDLSGIWDEQAGRLRALAWLADLYADPGLRTIQSEELTPQLRDDLLHLVSATDPPVDVFPWGREHLDRLVTWPVFDRGEVGRGFVAGVLAEAAREGSGRADRHAREALELALVADDAAAIALQSRGHGFRTAADLSESQRAVIAMLSEREHPGVSFEQFGLPALARNRRLWLASG